MSEFYLGLAVEFSYLFLDPRMPAVSQIYSIFRMLYMDQPTAIVSQSNLVWNRGGRSTGTNYLFEGLQRKQIFKSHHPNYSSKASRSIEGQLGDCQESTHPGVSARRRPRFKRWLFVSAWSLSRCAHRSIIKQTFSTRGEDTCCNRYQTRASFEHPGEEKSELKETIDSSNCQPFKFQRLRKPTRQQYTFSIWSEQTHSSRYWSSVRSCVT